MPKINLIQKICAERGVKPIYRQYRMLHDVPHIHKTALVVDEFLEGGGQRIIKDPKLFPVELTEEMIIGAIENGAYSLGRFIRKGAAGSKAQFIPWYNLVGVYPPGYFTHRLGFDVSGK